MQTARIHIQGGKHYELCMDQPRRNKRDRRPHRNIRSGTERLFLQQRSGRRGRHHAGIPLQRAFYYTEQTGDFVLTVRVSHNFRDTYDSASVMVMADMQNWGKACFEKTDFGTHAAVSVVTKNGESDDANGCNLDGNTAWLRICRAGNAFSFHYSVDGEHFYMMRFFTLPAGETVKVGLLAQAPVGNGGLRVYENLCLENRTVKNLRAGV